MVKSSFKYKNLYVFTFAWVKKLLQYFKFYSSIFKTGICTSTYVKKSVLLPPLVILWGNSFIKIIEANHHCRLSPQHNRVTGYLYFKEQVFRWFLSFWFWYGLAKRRSFKTFFGIPNVAVFLSASYWTQRTPDVKIWRNSWRLGKYAKTDDKIGQIRD